MELLLRVRVQVHQHMQCPVNGGVCLLGDSRHCSDITGPGSLQTVDQTTFPSIGQSLKPK